MNNNLMDLSLREKYPNTEFKIKMRIPSTGNTTRKNSVF